MNITNKLRLSASIKTIIVLKIDLVKQWVISLY